MPNTSDELQYMHDKLRTEILQNDALTLQLLGITLLLISAAMGFGLQPATPLLIKVAVFFAVMVLLLLSMLQAIERIRGTFMLASYLRIFVENKTEHLKWETRLDAFRKESPKLGYSRFNTILFIYVLITAANYMLQIFYSIYIFNKPDKKYFKIPLIHLSITAKLITISILAAGFIVMAIITFFAFQGHNKFAKGHNETFDGIWRKVFKEEYYGSSQDTTNEL